MNYKNVKVAGKKAFFHSKQKTSKLWGKNACQNMASITISSCTKFYPELNFRKNHKVLWLLLACDKVVNVQSQSENKNYILF